MGLPLWAVGRAGGLVGDLLVYAGAGFILAGALVQGPTPQFSFGGYLAAIYAAYLPTQIPIAIGEMVLTGAALHYAFLKRPEVLADGPTAEILGDAALLERARLEPPLLTKLFNRLAGSEVELSDIPLTIDQAAACLRIKAVKETT